MSNDSPPRLSDDPAVLKGVIAELEQELAVSYRLQEQLKHQIQMLARRLFGRRSERIDPNQLSLDFPEVFQPAAAAEDDEPPPEQEPAPTRKRRRNGRRRLPENLPRERVEHEPPAEQLQCEGCGCRKVRIGEETSEQLEYEPATMYVVEHVRGVWACAGCQEGVVTAPPAVKPIAKGLAGPGLLAQIVTSKYADHLPLNRQEGMFARQGVELSRSTMCDWIRDCADLATPVVEVMARDLLCSKVVHTDDTPVPVLDSDRGSTRTARLWVYLGDRDHPHTVFDYTPNRKRDGPLRFLAGFTGYLQADAYAGYDPVYASGAVKELACWAHARRKFYDARISEPWHAFTALAVVRQLYDVERKARDLSPEERCFLRQKHSRPILDSFGNWVEETARLILPKSPLGEAFTYVRGQWQALLRYTEDGDLAIDNNAAERALRCIAIGRKNWLFAGSDDGGRRAAVLYSLVVSCKRHGIDPFAYLRDLFTRLPGFPPDQLAELTPAAWAQALRDSLRAAA